MPPLQPFIHDLVTDCAAPTQVLSDRAGDITSSGHGPSAQGVIHADVRVVSALRVTVNGSGAEHIATTRNPRGTRFTGVLRHVAPELVDVADPVLRLDRQRGVSPGVVTEELVVSSRLTVPVEATIEVRMSSDFAAIETIKVGAAWRQVPLEAVSTLDSVRWRSGALTLALTCPAATIDDRSSGGGPQLARGDSEPGLDHGRLGLEDPRRGRGRDGRRP